MNAIPLPSPEMALFMLFVLVVGALLGLLLYLADRKKN